MSHAIRARRISFGYKGAPEPVVEGWSAGFPKGSVTSLSGPSGCGKSTTLFLLALMLRPRSGEVHLGGRRVDHLPDSERARLRAHHFGFVFQDACLDQSRTVIDNILEGTLYRRQARVELVDRAHQLLDEVGVAVPTNRRPGEVSGGQAQRIAMCRALVANPSVVFADEPTGNLDPASAKVVLTMLRQQADRGACVVIVTHDPDIAGQCDQQLHLTGRLDA